jgi:hypothetical protein
MRNLKRELINKRERLIYGESLIMKQPFLGWNGGENGGGFEGYVSRCFSSRFL